jgi:hypothetical protein
VEINLYFSDYFDVDPQIVRDYGALDLCVVSDLPVFVDPFLLFNSEKPEYQELHAQILKYLSFLRDRAADDGLNNALDGTARMAASRR